jgi:hypothetical protein
MALNLSRNTKVFVSSKNGVGATGGIKTAYISAKGTGYAVGNIVTLTAGSGGGTDAKCIVLTVNSGAVETVGIPNNFRGKGHFTAAADATKGTLEESAVQDYDGNDVSGASGLILKVLSVAGTTTADGNRIGTGTFKGNEVDTNTFRMGVLDGYSFSQGSDSTDVTISEAGATPNRGQKRFNDSLPPAEWSFGTYVRPFKHGAASFRANGTFDCCENILWAALSGTGLPGVHADAAAQATAGAGVSLGTSAITGSLCSFVNSDVHELMKLNLFFALENTTYRLNDAQVNQAEIDFSIDGIAQINWSGNATTIDQLSDPMEDPSKYYVTVFDNNGTFDASSAALLNAAGTVHSSIGTISVSGSGVLQNTAGEAITPFNNSDTYVETYNYVDTTGPSDADYLRNKLSSLYLNVGTEQGGGSASNGLSKKTYAINITGGSITIANNVTYVTPETIGVIDKPIGSFTGARVIGGSLNMYLDTKANGSNQLLSDLANATDLITNEFDMRLFMGLNATVTTVGGVGEAQEADDFNNAAGVLQSGVEFNMPKCHLTIPTIEVADLISTSVEFAAHGTSLLEGDEMKVKYIGVTTHTQTGYGTTSRAVDSL